MLATADKLHGTNYPVWAYLMRHVLVAKGLWNIVQGDNVRPIVVASTTRIGTGVGSTSIGVRVLLSMLHVLHLLWLLFLQHNPTAKQLCWDGNDAQAHALLALSIKRAIIPHIRSCKTLKEAWDTLATFH